MESSISFISQGDNSLAQIEGYYSIKRVYAGVAGAQGGPIRNVQIAPLHPLYGRTKKIENHNMERNRGTQRECSIL